MIKITSDSKIFVLCPKDSVTGGAELLHQIVHVLNEYGRNAYLVYFDALKNNNITSSEIPQDYLRYNIKLATSLEDKPFNVLVLYEAIFNKLFIAKEMQVMLWWLSVDNFYYTSNKYLAISDFFKWNLGYGSRVFLYRIKNLLLKGNNYFKHNLSLSMLAKMDCLNAYQSEYAQNFLQNFGFRELLPLKDYINDAFLETDEYENIPKENIILFNPKKGMKFTRKIIKSFPAYNWVPLENMSRAEMILNLKKAKVYVDFGFHPGKDRIPREAVMSGACVITGFDGSAGFFEDVPIYNKYKIKKRSANISAIGNLIGDILDNYESHKVNFDFYRERVRKEKEEFIIHTLEIFKQR